MRKKIRHRLDTLIPERKNTSKRLKDKIRESLNSFTPISGGDYDSDD